MKYTYVNVKSNVKFNLGSFFSKKFLVFVTLLFMVVLVFSPFVSMFHGISFFTQGAETPEKVVKNETELINTISAIASDKKAYVIGLSTDITLKNSLEIPSDKNIILVSVDGFWRLYGADKQNTITVAGVLTLDGIGVTHTDGDTGAGIHVNNNGALTLLSGEISDNTGTKDYYAANNTDCYSTKGGGVFVNSGGSFVMSGGKITNNKADIDGGGVHNRGTFTLSNGEISCNNAYIAGGVSNNGIFRMSGGIIDNNTAGSGGGVSNNRGPGRGVTFTMTGGKIIGNIANYTCGGVLYSKGSFRWCSGVISGNIAGSSDKDTCEINISFTYRHDDSDFGVNNEGFDREIKIKLLLLIMATIVAITGLLFYHSKKRKHANNLKQFST